LLSALADEAISTTKAIQAAFAEIFPVAFGPYANENGPRDVPWLELKESWSKSVQLSEKPSLRHFLFA